MASEYGYITVTELENFTNTDYSAVDATYTDTVIEANISQAERLINIYMGESFSSPIPDTIKYVALDVSFKLMHNRMVEEGIMDRENPKKYFPILNDENKELLDKYINKTQSNEVDLLRLYDNENWGSYNGLFYY